MENILANLNTDIFRKYREMWGNSDLQFPVKLVEYLKNLSYPLTLFAPTSETIRLINGDQQALVETFKALIIEKNRIDLDALKKLHDQSLPTSYDKSVTFLVYSTGTEVRIDSAKVVKEIVATDGIIFALDKIPKKRSTWGKQS